MENGGGDHCLPYPPDLLQQVSSRRFHGNGLANPRDCERRCQCHEYYEMSSVVQ
jgi:hypothetical protein